MRFELVCTVQAAPVPGGYTRDREKDIYVSGPATDITAHIGHWKTRKPHRFMKEVTLDSVMYS